MIDFDVYKYDDEAIRLRTSEILKEGLSLSERKEALKTILGCIDLTSLEGSDHDKKIVAMCEQARSFSSLGEGIPNVAAVCFYSPFIKLARRELLGTGIKVATVAAGFPGGQVPLTIKIDEVAWAAAAGADEIDIVVNRGKILSQKCYDVYEDLVTLKEAAGKACLKVILETGELQTVNFIRQACKSALNAGADFLKTSTGKFQPAATPEAFLVMLDSIREFHDKTGRKVGIKAAGGIAEPDEALKYCILTKHILGDEWLNKNLFRIGASRLAGKVAEEIVKNR